MPLQPPATGPGRARRTLRACLTGVIASFVAGTGLVAGAGAAHADEDEPRDVVVIGVGGMHWSDVDRVGTPTLWRMVGEGAVGSISVHTSSAQMCRLGAWETVSAGRRVPPVPTREQQDPDDTGTPGSDAGDGTDDGTGDGSDDAFDDCRPLPGVSAATDAVGPATVRGWSDLAVPSDDEPAGSYGRPGTVGALLEETGRCTTAIGPGAAIALADARGKVERYAPTLGAVGDDELRACPVTVVDAGDLPADRTDRRDALGLLDDELRRVLAAVEDGTDVVVAGISDGPAGESGLQAIASWRAGGGTIGWLTSSSTRRTGIVTLTDLSATLVAAVGGPSADLDGAPLEVGPERRMSTDRTVENRRYLTEMTTITPHLLPLLLAVVGVVVGLVLVSLLVLRRRHARPPPALRRVTVAVLLVGACTPVGAQLAALSRWWGAPAPMFAAAAWWAVATTAVALAAWGLSRRMPAGPWRLAIPTAALTWLVVTVDGLTGTVLQQGSILGVTPTLGARYYGFGNTTFGVYAAASLVLAAGVAALARAAGRRGLALAAVVVVGVVTVVVDGWPAFGADFGGVLALVPAFAVLLLGAVGGPVNARRAVLFGGVAVLVVAVVSVVDWARPGRSSHLGLFVQRVLDGEAFAVVLGKAAGAWATVAQPLGATAAVVCLAVCVLLVGPQRWRPAVLRRVTAAWPGLDRLLQAVAVAALVGSLLNDSGVVVATAVLGVAGAVLLASLTADRWAALPDDPAPVRSPLRRMPAVVATTGGGLLAALLLVTVVVPLSAAVPGAVTAGRGTPAVPQDAPVVVVGTSGVDWSKVDRTATPTLWGLLRDGAPAGGVTPGATGRSAWCSSGGWLALSSGRAALAGSAQDGAWRCASWWVQTTADGGATVPGWADLVALQSASEFRPRLGALGEGLAASGECSTAVGPRAALALALPDGTVPRYRTFADMVADAPDAFSCPTTVVDAGSATPPALAKDVAGDQAGLDALRAVDANVARVLRAAPADATVLVVDTGIAGRGRPVLGVGIGDTATRSGFLTTPATRWVGVIRLLDLPLTLLTHAGAVAGDDFAGSPAQIGAERPSEVATTVQQLEDLTARDQALRGTSTPVTTPPLLLALLVLALATLLGPRLVRARPPLAERLRRAADVVLLVLATLPVASFLITTTAWWRAADPDTALWVALAGWAAVIAACVALLPRRPVLAGPGVLAALTFGVLTLDALLGTPLHRGSPQGPAVTLGGRFYGFGNPTYSVYVVAALVTAAVLGGALVRRGRRLLGTCAAAAVCGIALVVDLWPGLGADVGGGLVLVPASLVVVLGVAGVRVTWLRLLVAGAAGVLLVGGIAVLDWLRPAADRTHLGVFVQRIADGSAWETVARKLGYAAATVTTGWLPVLTLAVLVLVALALWPVARVRVPGWPTVERAWPLARPVTVALLIAGVAGGLVNDYGVRIATVMLVTALPLFGMIGLRAATPTGPGLTAGRDDYPASTSTDATHAR
ncbi:hypothetical protein [Cellulomonas sp.]|uniref:hypothetical protein n=1 Tax=Cellulomonas sp. TaxID=40001 RepID=UPI0025903606|nr:hypothetical protein [Cellulomonas sp.]MCR6688402.1 hypothetical protein [Cellulomonas sp.]